MKIGVVGSNGFVGSALCAKFVSEGHNVFAFFNERIASIPNECVKVSLKSEFSQQLDCLIISIGKHDSTNQQYLEHYRQIDSIFKKIAFKKVLFISSVDVYGKSKKIISVDSCFNAPKDYGISKISQEFLVKSLDNHVIIRSSYLYGKGMGENSLLPNWLNSAKSKNEIIVYGEGARKQDYLNIDDLVDLCSIVANDSNIIGKTIIAASGNSISNFEIAKEIQRLLPRVKITFKGEDTTESSFFDISETQKIVNWSPKKHLMEWINSTLNNENSNL